MRRGTSTQGCLAHIGTTLEDARAIGYAVPGVMSEDRSK